MVGGIDFLMRALIPESVNTRVPGVPVGGVHGAHIASRSPLLRGGEGPW